MKKISRHIARDISIALAAASIAFSACKPSSDKISANPIPDASSSSSNISKPIQSSFSPIPSNQPSAASTSSSVDESSIKPFSEEDLRNAKKIPRMILLGDSIIVDKKDQVVSKRISELFGNNSSCRETLGCQCVGQGKEGQLIRDYIMKRFKEAVDDPDSNMIIVEGGVNDILFWIMNTQESARERAFDRFLSLFNEMAQMAYDNKKAVVFVTMTPWRGFKNWTPEAQRFTERLNAHLKSLRYKKNIIVADPYHLLAIKEPRCDEEIGMMKEGYRGRDHLHPNEEGRRVIAEVIVQTIGMRAQITQPLPSTSNVSPVASSPCIMQPSISDGGIPASEAGIMEKDAGTDVKEAGNPKNPLYL